MKHLSRRDFVHAGCTVAAATLAPSIVDKAEAYFPHGFIATTVNNNRVTINAQLGYLNLASGFGFSVDPNNQSTNGYPVTSPAVGTYGSNPSFPLGYYGQYVWKWSNTGAMIWIGGPPLIVSASTVNGVSSGVIYELTGATSGDLGPGNHTFVTPGSTGTGLNTPRVVLSFGWNIQSISSGTGGVITINTKAGYVSGGTGTIISISGANSNTGANGVWTITNPTSSSFDLVGSTFTNAQASAGGTATFAPQNQSISMYSNGSTTYSSMSGLVICKSSDETAITSGQLIDGQLVSQYQQLFGIPGGVGRGNAGWLRFMDAANVQLSFDSDFSQRCPASYLTYPGAQGRFCPGYWSGAVSWSAGDVYTCSDPSVSTWSGSVYNDNAVVQGTIDLTNLGANPTLNVGGHGAKPIINLTIIPITFEFSGVLPSSAGQTITLTFAAIWLNGGTPYPFNYTTVTNDTLSFTGGTGLQANLMAALGADAVLSAGKIGFGYSGPDTLHSIPAALPRTAQAGRLTISLTTAPTGLQCTVGALQPLSFSGGKVRSTLSGSIVTGDVLNYTFNRGDLSGGAYTLAYTTNTVTNGPGGVPDSSLQNLVTNLVAQTNADATLKAAGITASTSQMPPATFFFAQGVVAGGGGTPTNGSPWDAWTGGTGATLTVSFTKVSGIGTEAATQYSTGSNQATFVYNYLLDGWLYKGGGLIQSTPYEAIVELCNRVGANCWLPLGTTKGANVTAVANYFATNLSAGLKFGNEPWNEIWNSGANPFGQLQALGCALGFTTGGDNPPYSYAALRIIQYSALAKAAWISAGKPAANYYVFQPSAEFDLTINGNFDLEQLQGQSLTTTNTIYATYGGLNGSGSSPSYTVAGSQPVDITTVTGCAPYWGSPWWGGNLAAANQITGNVTVNAPWLQASLDYTNGSVATSFTSITNQFNGTTPRSSGGNVGIPLIVGSGSGFYLGPSGVFSTEEALCASYDMRRASAGLPPLGIMHYEGGPQWGIGANAINGFNALSSQASSIASADITALANQMTGLGWNVSAYTVSGTNNAIECATQVLTMAMGWKYDTDKNGNAANTGSYKSFIKTQYYQALINISASNRETHPAQYGYSASQWGLFPGSYTGANPYQNYNAIAEYNA